MPRTADAVWNGSLKEGEGTVKLGGGAFEGNYTFKSRFEGGEEGTNPEELIAAAHAACFSMATSGELGKAGIDFENVETNADVTLKMLDAGPTITRILLTTTVTAPGADEGAVREAAEAAKKGCPISRALAAVETIDLDLTVNA
jgi:osmotically inducible protein OsmC